MPVPDLSPEERDKLEAERLEDLVANARKLVERAGERLSIDTGNWKRMKVLGMDARCLLVAAVSVLDRL
jgi:hypothetical protein